MEIKQFMSFEFSKYWIKTEVLAYVVTQVSINFEKIVGFVVPLIIRGNIYNFKL